MLWYRIQMGACVTLLLALGGYAAWQVHKYGVNLPPPNPEFVRRINFKPANPQGDADFLCQTMYCNETDHYVGIQTHFLYADRSHVMWGVPVSYARLKFNDGSTGKGGTNDVSKMHPPVPVQVGSNGATRH